MCEAASHFEDTWQLTSLPSVVRPKKLWKALLTFYVHEVFIAHKYSGFQTAL